MSQLLPSAPLLAAFIAASLVLAITPGPGVLYIVTRSLAQGRRAGLASVAGVALGNLGNAIGAAIGLAALFAVSSLAFTVVKYAGAAYLIYLGVRTLRAEPAEAQLPGTPPASAGRILRDGFLVALLNPKTAIFFAAFLPQFTTPGASPMGQSITLGALFVAVAAVTDSGYAFTASLVAPRLAHLGRARRVGRGLIATALIGLGLYSAAGGSHRSR